MEIKPIAYIHTDFPEKFGIPRQSGIVKGLKGKIIFEPKYRDASALRGLEDFTHLWLIWKFSANDTDNWSPTVRPPRLGGNKRMGVFATRAPFRPNPIGLSCVKIEGITLSSVDGPIIEVSGADMLDGTPIYDIKPYIPYTDAHIEASGGFSDEVYGDLLKVEISDELIEKIPKEKSEALKEILSSDPRPAYKADGDRVYGFDFAGHSIKFKVESNKLTVTDIK
jgi:tRNA-Thr(GGU) m(6)t(6)A37 methyltransferase TsaA